MRKSSPLQALCSFLLIIAVASPISFGSPLPPNSRTAAIPESATITGIVALAGGSPIPGAVVKAADVVSGHMFESASSDARGEYVLPGLPAGDYSLAIQTTKGLYLSSGVVNVQKSSSHRYSFNLRDAAAGEGGDSKDSGGSAKKASWWATHPVLAGVIVAGSAVVLGVAADQISSESNAKASGESNPSPSAP